MQIIAETNCLRQQILQWRREGQTIAFVPTMGDIHEGHLALVREAKAHADVVVVSIFTNQLQQDKNDEMDSAARILEQDIATLEENGVALLFTPILDEMLTNTEQQVYLEVPNSGTKLFNADVLHPKYLQIFTTTICKLFNIVQPDIVCVGENNVQRLAIVRKLINDLCFSIQVRSVPTVRELDGLVSSRRNKKLTVDERQRAAVLAKTLRWASGQIRGGRRDFNELILDCVDQLRAAGLEPDEILIRDTLTLQPAQEKTEKVLICASIKLSNTKLVDNFIVDIASPATNVADEEEFLTVAKNIDK